MVAGGHYPQAGKVVLLELAKTTRVWTRRQLELRNETSLAVC